MKGHFDRLENWVIHSIRSGSGSWFSGGQGISGLRINDSRLGVGDGRIRPVFPLIIPFVIQCVDFRNRRLCVKIRVGKGKREHDRSSKGQRPPISRIKGVSTVRPGTKFIDWGHGTRGWLYVTKPLVPPAGLCERTYQA